jgi:ribosomal protein S18 acetylase RimI-like enzyme
MNPRLLLDTNVFFSLEDPKEVNPATAELMRLCSAHGLQVYLHDAAELDIARDRNLDRRSVSLSKLGKFQRIPLPVLPPKHELERAYGTIKKENDLVDVTLLHTVKLGVVEFLITEDLGIHSRARNAALSNQVFTVADALMWARRQFSPVPVSLPLIEERKAHEIDLTDDLFASLRQGYDDFDDWWKTKCIPQHRDCWVASIDGKIAGLVVRKTETQEDARTKNVAHKILKICTFKVREEFRGERLGELLIKQILWFAQRNQYDLVYLTTKSGQNSLIQLCEYFGFSHTRTDERAEMYFERLVYKKRLAVSDGVHALIEARTSYPRFSMRPPVGVYYVPIQPSYHEKLFPEAFVLDPLPLFPDADRRIRPRGARTPGNTIRKVYLSNANMRSLRAGDVLLFYHSKGKNLALSQSLTTIGVVESVAETASHDELIRLTAKRSVFGEPELKRKSRDASGPIKLVDFLLMGHFEPAIPLSILIEYGIIGGQPPQAICRIPGPAAMRLVPHINWGFEI